MQCRKCKRDIPENSIFCNWCGEKQLRERKKKEQIKVPAPRQLPSGNWFIQLRLGGKSHSITASTEKECIRLAEHEKAAYRAGKKMPDPESENPKLPTLGDAIDNYIDKRNAVLSPSTIRGYKAIKRTRFKPLTDISLQDITPDTWQTACNAEAKLCSAKTLKNAWGFISSVLQDAGQQPPKVKLPQVVANERPFLEPDQIKLFIAAVHNTDVEIPALLALSSLRRSELLALRWENIDLKKRTMKIKGAAVYNEDGRLVQKEENKNASSARTVPIMMDELYNALNVSKKKSGLVVTGHPLTIYKHINDICEKNGFPEVGIHGLRHSFVSLAYHLGVPEKVVMDIGGWSDYQTMRKIYTHIARSDVKKHVTQFTEFFSEIPRSNT